MIEAIGAVANEMAANEIALEYSIAMARKAMEVTELAGKGAVEMIQSAAPAHTPHAAGPLGIYIDTYA